VLAIIEVADSSINYDRTAKALLYARAGVAVYWLFDVNARRVTLLRRPTEDGCQDIREVEQSESLEIESVPGWSLPLHTVFSGFNP
jgi:Uma2 family endonuclease